MVTCMQIKKGQMTEHLVLRETFNFFKVYEGYKSHTNKGYTIQRWDTTQKLIVLVHT